MKKESSRMLQRLGRFFRFPQTVKGKLSFLLFVQVLLLVIWYGSTIAIELNSFVRQSQQADERMAEQIQQSVDEYIQGMQSVTAFPVLRDGNGLPKDIYKHLSHDSHSSHFPESIVQSLESDVANVFNLSPVVDRLAVVNLSGHGLMLDRNTLGGNARRFIIDMQQPWVSGALSAKGSATNAMRLNTQQLGYHSAGSYLYCARAIVYAEEYRVIGLAIAGIRLTRIETLPYMQSDIKGQSVLVRTPDGQIICGPEEDTGTLPPFTQTHQTVRLGSTPYAATRLSPEQARAEVTVLTPWVSRLMHLNAFSYTFYFLIMALIIFMIWVSSSIVRSIKNPISQLLVAVDAYAQGDFSYQTDPIRGTEFSRLAQALNRMSRRIALLIEEVYLQKLEKKENELRVLRSQINPHFLYNALESARMKAYVNQDYEVESMVTRLSDVLRYGLVSSVEPVTLEMEMENLQEYMDIYNTSYGNRIELSIMVEPACMQVRMPRVTLQPLAENSIKHGFLKGSCGGTLSLLGYVEDGVCTLKLTDDGAGTDPETLQRLRQRLGSASLSDQQGYGIGLYNVHRRITLMFGEEYGIGLDAQQDHGFAVSIRLPAAKEGEEDAAHSAG